MGIISDGRRGDEVGSRLDKFIEKRFPGAKIVLKTAGLTPKYQGECMFRSRNLLMAGDAARALDSLTGAGIVNAMMSGKYAGQAAVEYLSDGVDDPVRLESLYPGRFLEAKADELSLYLKLKNVYMHLNDDDFIDIIKALGEYFKEKRTEGINAGRLLAGLIRTRPRLIRLVKYLL